MILMVAVKTINELSFTYQYRSYKVLLYHCSYFIPIKIRCIARVATITPVPVQCSGAIQEFHFPNLLEAGSEAKFKMWCFWTKIWAIRRRFLHVGTKGFGIRQRQRQCDNPHLKHCGIKRGLLKLSRKFAVTQANSSAHQATSHAVKMF